MKNLCVKLPEKYFEGLEQLVKSGVYPNVSEAARVAIRDFLQSELEKWSTTGRTARTLTFA